MNLSPGEIVEMILHYTTDIDSAQKDLEDCLPHEARAHGRLIEQKAEAWRRVQGRSREEREAYVDDTCREAKLAYELAVGRSKAAMEKVRNRRQQMTAVQTAANLIRSEAELAGKGPVVDSSSY